MKHSLLSYPIFRPVTANLLMFVLLAAGGLGLAQMRQEFMPNLPLRTVAVAVQYPGAGVEEIEHGLLMPIENAVREVDGVRRITGEATDGAGTVMVRLANSTDENVALQAVKNAVDALSDLPQAAERPQVRLVSDVHTTMTLLVHGPQSEAALRELANRVCVELRDLEEVTRVELVQKRPAEISIEVPERRLREHGLTLDALAEQVAANARQVSGGLLRSLQSEYSLQSGTRREACADYAELPVATAAGGTLRLREIADVVDAQGTAPVETTFNGDPAVLIDVYRVGDETPAGIARAVGAYLSRLRLTLPAGTDVRIVNDHAEAFSQRVNFLLSDAWQGLVLVLILLGLFFEVRLAFWVMMGIPTTVLGGLALMPSLGVTLNMLSLVAFILTFGIVADDAIMIGEAVWHRREQGDTPLQAALRGLQEMKGLVCLVVLTNVIGFLPMLLIDGAFGPVFRQVGLVVIACFVVSLVEALFVFPAHVAHSREGGRWVGRLNRPQVWLNRHMENWIQRTYVPWIDRIVRHPWVFAIAACSILGLTAALLASGQLRFSFAPETDADSVVADAVLPQGSSPAQARRVRDLLVAGARAAMAANGGAEIARGITCTIGMPLGSESEMEETETGNHLVGVEVSLVPLGRRKITGTRLAEEWRRATGQIAGVESVRFSGTQTGVGGEDLVVELRHADEGQARAAAEELGTLIRGVPGVASVETGMQQQRPELAWTPRAEAERRGLTARALGEQLRHRFHGAEALRFQRGGEDVRVMVRLPAAERERYAALEDVRIVFPDGSQSPLGEVATLELGRAPLRIERADGVRIVPVRVTYTNDADDSRVGTAIQGELLPELQRRHPGLGWSIGGDAREVEDALRSLLVGTILAGVLLYAMLAVRFNSYIQPVLVMSVIPLGAAGALWGHLLLGSTVNIMSLVGIVAMAGVVVNESLVYVAAANSLVEEGLAPREAAVLAAVRRFRPILLTSITTFGGLFPILTETSEQARFIVPMIVSMSFGQLFSTLAVLGALPNLYLFMKRRRSADANGASQPCVPGGELRALEPVADDT